MLHVSNITLSHEYSRHWLIHCKSNQDIQYLWTYQAVFRASNQYKHVDFHEICKLFWVDFSNNKCVVLKKNICDNEAIIRSGLGKCLEKKMRTCKEKCLEKKFVQPLRQRKKIRASKQQSTNSLEKILAEVKCIKKNPAETWDWKKIRAAKILYPPPLPGYLIVRPLGRTLHYITTKFLLKNFLTHKNMS